jgi:hypothetical protein
VWQKAFATLPGRLLEAPPQVACKAVPCNEGERDKNERGKTSRYALGEQPILTVIS